MKHRTVIDPSKNSCSARALGPRGATMVSVMLMSVSMITIATLVMRASQRDTQRASAKVAREQAAMAAHASVELAAAHYRRAFFMAGANKEQVLSDALAGSNPPSDSRFCTRDLSSADGPDKDCIPGTGSNNPRTGQRNSALTSGHSDCSGRPCMRPGALVMLPGKGSSTDVPWSSVPMGTLLEGGDPEALVTVWVRNNSSEALGASGTGSWIVDKDGRVVITGMARVRNSTVTVEQEYYFLPRGGVMAQSPPTPDEGYGGGHNGDNSAVAVCEQDYASSDLTPPPSP